MALCVQFYTIPIFQQSYQMIYVAPDMLKGQPKNAVCFDYLINAPFNHERSPRTQSRLNAYKRDGPSSRGQQAGWEEERRRGFKNTHFPKAELPLSMRPEKLLLKAKDFALLCPFWVFLRLVRATGCSGW